MLISVQCIGTKLQSVFCLIAPQGQEVMHTFTKARMLWGNIYSLSNERPFRVQYLLVHTQGLPVYLGQLTNTAVLSPVQCVYQQSRFILTWFSTCVDPRWQQMHDALHLEIVLITCQWLSHTIDLFGEPRCFAKQMNLDIFGITYKYCNIFNVSESKYYHKELFKVMNEQTLPF